MALPALQPRSTGRASEIGEPVARLHEHAVHVGLDIERLARAADIFKMRAAAALHVPVAGPDPDAERLVKPIREQRFQLIAPAVSILADGQRQIGAQQMVVGARHPDIRKPRTFNIEPPAIDQRNVGVDAEPYRLPGIVLDNDGDAVGNAAGADEWVGRRLLAAKGFHALMEIVIADKAIDTEVAAAPEGAAQIG